MSSSEEESVPIRYGIEDASDVILVVQKQEFHVHKMFLAARSDVFYAMFKGNFKEAKENRVEIKDVDAKTFRRFLDILYNGQVSDLKDFAHFPLQTIPCKSTTCTYCRNYLTCTHNGDGCVAHCTVADVILQEFWLRIGKVLNIADRYSMKKIIEDYLKLVIYNELCTKKDCLCCLNSLIFAEKHGLDVPKRGTYSNDTVIKWIKIMGPTSLEINTNVLCKFFT